MQKMQFVVLAASLCACSDRETELGLHVDELQRQDGTSITVACEGDDGAMSDRACVLGSDGAYASLAGEEEIVVPAEPPYGAYVKFSEGFVLNPDGLITEGTNPAIRADVRLSGAVDGEPAYRAPVNAEMSREGGLLMIIDDELPAGASVNIVLEFGADMFLSWPEGSACPDGGLGCMGFGFGFFVAEAPPSPLPARTSASVNATAESSP